MEPGGDAVGQAVLALGAVQVAGRHVVAAKEKLNRVKCNSL